MAGTFIPCTTGTVALYQQADEGILAMPVEAWDDAGAPYIAGATALVAASSRSGFLRLEPAAVALPPARAPKTPVQVGPREKPRGRGERSGV